MHTRWLGRDQQYDGTQLRPLYAYMETGLLGPSVLCFRGPCAIPFEHMVDGEDVRSESAIQGGDMLHFIIEFFHQNLFSAVAFQRLIADLASRAVNEISAGAVKMKRDGDDLYFEDRKFSISIASVSPVSQMIHFAVNITNENTPVKTCALADFNINHTEFGDILLRFIAAEFTTIIEATQKVRPL